MGRLNPEKFSQRLQDLNRYLDYIPIERTSDRNKVTKAYGKGLPEDELRSIMGRVITPEWTANLLSLGKEPWKFRDLEDQLNVYRKQWQADQQKQIIAQMAGKHPNKLNEGKRKNSDRNHHNSNGGRGSNRHGNTSHGGRGGRGRGRGGRDGTGNNSEHLQSVECYSCGKKGHYSNDFTLPKKNTQSAHMVSKDDFKNLFQTSMKEMFTKNKYKEAKANAEGDDDYLDMNVFKKLMEGKQPMSVLENNDDLTSINDTNTCDYYIQNKCTHRSIKHNDYSNDYDELAYPFSKRVKLKHEPEKAHENVPVQYTADIILEIKNIYGKVVPMRAFLDTGTTATIILREFVGKGRARTNKKKRKKWKTLGGTFTTNYESLLDFKFPEIITSKAVTWQAHVDDTTSSKEADYDMIMGMDLISSIGISVDCEQKCIRWGGTEIPLRTSSSMNNYEILHMLYHPANEPDILQESEKRQNRILDADYRKIEVDPFVEELKHLTMDEKQILGKKFKKFPTLFGGVLGMLNIKPVKLELIDGTKHYHARPFPVPQYLEAKELHLS
jgi:hypothetical protein